MLEVECTACICGGRNRGGCPLPQHVQHSLFMPSDPMHCCRACCCCRVYYSWALQQEQVGYVGADGGYHPPRWQLREMMVRGMHKLL